MPDNNYMHSKKSFWISFAVSMLYLIVGFAFLHFGWAEYGWVIFVALPVAIGTATGFVSIKKIGLFGLLLALVSFFCFLLFSQLEGFLCVLCATPIFLVPFFLGRWISILIAKYLYKKQARTIKVSLLPLLIVVLAIPVENAMISEPVVEIQATSRILPYSPEQVYDAIKSVDTLDVEKPWLMHLNLPIPYKCILEKEEVGGLRTCYFEGGRIIEQVTAIERGKHLKMDVIDYELTGRKWLGFKEAIYEFEKVGQDSCRITRITTYTSELKPRAYWQPLEELGIQQEHQFVLDNLEKDLKSTN